MMQHRPDRQPGRSLAVLALVCLAALAGRVGPARALGDLDARYSVATTGIAIGEADLSLRSRAEELAVRFRFENGSLLGLVEPSLTELRSVLVYRGRQPTPRRYAGLFRKEDRDREVTVGYGDAGEVDAFRFAKRGRVRIEAVPAGLPPGTADPLATLVRVHVWLDRAMEGDVLELPVFDGRKLYQASLRYHGPVQMTQGGESLAAHLVRVRYRQVAQLDEDKGTLEPETDGERNLDAMMSADGRYLPLRVSGSFDGLPLTAELTADCRTEAGCPAAGE